MKSRAAIVAIDVSSALRWLGPPTGMIRVEHSIAMFAANAGPNFVLTVFEPRSNSFKILRPWFVAVMRDGATQVLEIDEPLAREKKRRRIFPSRRDFFFALGRWRLQSSSPRLQRGLARMQRWVMAGKPRNHPYRAFGRDGRPLSFVRYDDLLGEALDLASGDLLYFVSSDWWHKDAAVLRVIADHARDGVKIAANCYDILPLTHPQWFGEPAGSGEDILRFKRYWDAFFCFAATIIVNSDHVRREILDYCARFGGLAGEIRIVALGADRPNPARALPSMAAGLEPNKFALFVSTIEPRKNHAMLLRVWRQLLADRAPQREGFKLVFVGRRGWKVDDVLRQLDAPDAFAGTVLHLENVEDAQLEALYRHCAFCLYPSQMEGFGLPIVEAFARGKAVIASNAGSLAEVVGPFSPTLDPFDDVGWTALLKEWIEQPQARASYVERLGNEYVLSTWEDVARRCLAAAQGRAS